MLTDEQQIDIAYKLLQGRSSTNPDRAVHEEPVQSAPTVAPRMIWFEANLIPSTAPTIPTTLQLEPTTGLTLDYGEEGVVRYFAWLPLTALAGSPNTYFHPCLKNCIPFTYAEDGSYAQKLRNAADVDLAFGIHDWVIDSAAGTLTFFGDDLASIGVSPSHPPKISFYQYIGHEGITPIPDSTNLLQNNIHPDAQARLVVDAVSGTSVYHLPVDTGTILVRNTDIAANIVPKFVNNSTLGASSISDDGTTVTINADTEFISPVQVPQITIGTSLSTSDHITLVAPTEVFAHNYTVTLPKYDGTLVVRAPLVLTTATRLAKFIDDAKLVDSHILNTDTDVVIELPTTVENYIRATQVKINNAIADTTVYISPTAGEVTLKLPEYSGTIIGQATPTTPSYIPKTTVNGIIADSHITDTDSAVTINVATDVLGELSANTVKIGDINTFLATLVSPPSVSGDTSIEEVTLTLPKITGTLIAENTITTANKIPKFTADGVIANSTIEDTGTLVTIRSDVAITGSETVSGSIKAPTVIIGSGSNLATLYSPNVIGNVYLEMPVQSGVLMRTADHIPSSQADFTNTDTSSTTTDAQAALSELFHIKLQYAGVITSGPAYPDPAIVGGIYIIASEMTLGGTSYLKSDFAVYTGGSPYSGWMRIPAGLGDAHNVAFNKTDVTYGDGVTPVATTQVQAALADIYAHKADLDGTGRLPASQLPLSVVGALQYQGTWDVSIPSQTYPADTIVGHFYVVVGGPATVEGVYFTNGDWIIRNTSGWDHIQGGDTVDTIRVGATGLHGTVDFAATLPLVVSAGSNTVTYSANAATKTTTGIVQIGDALTVDANGIISIDATAGVYINGTSKKLEVNLNSNGLEIDGNNKLGIKASSSFTYNLGTLYLAATGVVSGTYPKVAVNPQGQVTAGYALAVSDVPVYASGETGAIELYNPVNGKVAGIKAKGPVAITKVADLVTLDFTQTNAIALSSKFETTTPADFDWTSRATTTDTIISLVGAVNANREDLDQYITLLRTQGAPVETGAGANLIGVDAIPDVIPTGQDTAGDSTLQAMLEGLRDYSHTITLSYGTENQVAKFGAAGLVSSSITDTESLVTISNAALISQDLSINALLTLQDPDGTGYNTAISVSNLSASNILLYTPYKAATASGTLLADFSTIDGGDFG